MTPASDLAGVAVPRVCTNLRVLRVEEGRIVMGNEAFLDRLSKLWPVFVTERS
jgi:hypothetical protein